MCTERESAKPIQVNLTLPPISPRAGWEWRYARLPDVASTRGMCPHHLVGSPNEQLYDTRMLHMNARQCTPVAPVQGKKVDASPRTIEVALTYSEVTVRVQCRLSACMAKETKQYRVESYRIWGAGPRNTRKNKV